MSLPFPEFGFRPNLDVFMRTILGQLHAITRAED